MIRQGILGAVALLAVTASPAFASTVINFTNPTTTIQSSYSTTAGGIGADVSAYTFTGAPNALTNLAALTSFNRLSVSVNGIGVCTESTSASSAGGSSGECPQVDTNGSPNEALLFDFSGTGNYNILQAVLNIVDTNDTLGLYGVAADGTLSLLGFGSTIALGGAGFTSVLTSSATPNAGPQYTLTFNPVLTGFNRYLFTTRTDGADGYRLRSLTIAAVPEPEIWAMLLLGFAGIGLQMRRRRGMRAVTA